MSDGLKSFMSEPVSLKRWKIYVLTFGFSAFGIMAIIGLLDLSLRAALAATFKASLFALGVLVMSHWASWPKRVRNVLAFALIGIALLLLIAVWHGGTAK